LAKTGDRQEAKRIGGKEEASIQQTHKRGPYLIKRSQLTLGVAGVGGEASDQEGKAIGSGKGGWN